MQSRDLSRDQVGPACRGPSRRLTSKMATIPVHTAKNLELCLDHQLPKQGTMQFRSPGKGTGQAGAQAAAGVLAALRRHLDFRLAGS